MSIKQKFNGDKLTAKGLNLHAIFNLADLPAEIAAQLNQNCAHIERYRQLIIVGHGGKALWHQLNITGLSGPDPIDDYSTEQVTSYLSSLLNPNQFEVVYPQSGPVSLSIDLQSLGRLAGWHHESPFRVGINQRWGSWFAYRCLLLADSHFAPIRADKSESPCRTCSEQPCIKACPAGALAKGRFALEKCLNYRRQPQSQCRDRCLARMACPVAKNEQYELSQIEYHYSQSFEKIK